MQILVFIKKFFLPTYALSLSGGIKIAALLSLIRDVVV